jgi:hypothetical protein
LVLRLRDTPPSNWDSAKCKLVAITKNYDPFYSDDPEETQEAIDFCNGDADGVVCPIRQECLRFALSNNCKDGIWGGTSEITRKAIRVAYPPDNEMMNENWTWMSEESARALVPGGLLTQEEDDE